MKHKLHVLILKLINTNINSCQAAMHYYVYVLMSVFFASRIIDLSLKEGKVLVKIHEEPLLVKLGLSSKYYRKALCNRKEALGIRLMKPKIIVDMVKLKLFVDNKQKEGNAKVAI